MGKVSISRTVSGLNVYLDNDTAMALGGEGRKVVLYYSISTDILYITSRSGARDGLARHNNPAYPYRVTFKDKPNAGIPKMHFGPTLMDADCNPGAKLPEALRSTTTVFIQMPPPNDRTPARAEIKRNPPVGRGASVQTLVKSPRERLRETVATLNTLIEQGHAQGIEWDWVYTDQGPNGNAEPVVKTLRMPGKLRGRIAETFE